MHKTKHLEIVDRFAKDEIGTLKQELQEVYKAYISLKHEYDNAVSMKRKDCGRSPFLNMKPMKSEVPL